MAAVTAPTTLRLLRYQQHLSLEDVAKKLAVHPTTVSAWETGKHEPGLAKIAALADLYKQSVETIIRAALNPTPALGKSRPKRRLKPAPAM